MNDWQKRMVEALEAAEGFLVAARRKVESGDVHGAQARIAFAQRSLADFLEESVAVPKNESGYVR